MRQPLNVILLVVLILGSALRLVGLTRGHSDFGGDTQATAFHRFHPDEEMVIRAALQPLDLQDPPLTVYGMLPLYLLRGVLELAAPVLHWGPLDLDAPNMAAPIYYTARVLAALAAALVLWFVWLLGRRYFKNRLIPE